MPPTYDFQSRIIIEIRDDAARRRLREIDREARRSGRAFNYAGRRGGIFRRVLNTITKALLSMVGVLFAFNVLVTGPQFALRLLVQGFKFAIDAVAEFEQRILGIQAILASTLRFDSDLGENFIQSGLVAEKVVGRLADRAAEMVGSLEDATIVFQTLLSSGAQKTVDSVSELVDLTVLLSNSIIGLTVGQGRQRQLAEETRSLFTGQVRATSLLARLLFKNRREMELFFEAAEKSGDLVERLETRLSGFVFASADFATTLDGVRSSLETILQIVLHRALGAPGGVLGNLFDQLAALAKAVQADEERVLRLTAAVSASARVIFKYATEIFGLNKYLNDSGTLLDFIIGLIPLFTQGVVYLIALSRSLLISVIAVYKVLNLVFSLFGAIFRFLRETQIIGFLIEVIRFVINLALSIIDLHLVIFDFLGTTEDRLNRLARLAQRLGIANEAIDEAANAYKAQSGSVQDLTDQFNSLLDTLKEGEALVASLDISEQGVSDFYVFLKDELPRIVDNMERLRDAKDKIALTPLLDVQDIIDVNKELLRTVSLTRRQASSVRAVLDASARGLIPRDIVTQLAGQVDEIASVLRQRIRQVADQLFEAQLEFARADTSVLFLSDPSQLRVLEDQILGLKGEISALAAELAALDRVTLHFADTTLQDLGATFTNIVKINIFEELLLGFRRLRGELERPLDFESVTQKLIERLDIVDEVEEIKNRFSSETADLTERITEALAEALGADKITAEILDLADRISTLLTREDLVFSIESIAKRIGISLKEIIRDIQEYVTSAEGLTAITAAVGDTIAHSISQAIQGIKSFGEAFRELVGMLLITLGTEILAAGVVTLIGAIFDPSLLAEAAVLIATGTALIAAGSALSPSGGGGAGVGAGAGAPQTPEFAFAQQQIAARQHFDQATESLRLSSQNLNEASQNLGGVRPGELFVKGSAEAGGITRVLANDVRRGDRFASTRDAALAFEGF